MQSCSALLMKTCYPLFILYPQLEKKTPKFVIFNVTLSSPAEKRQLFHRSLSLESVMEFLFLHTSVNFHVQNK